MKRTLTMLIVPAAVFILLVLMIPWYQAYAPSAQAPAADPYEGWATATQSAGAFRYPDPLHGSYVSAVAWPPELSLASTTCKTGTKLIGNSEYCYREESEGAAGSTYVTYVYARGAHELTFTLRYPQCANYDEPSQSSCKLEQETFDVDTLAARILSSVQ